MPLYDFQCKEPDCQHVERDYLVPQGELWDSIPCPVCGTDAHRLPSIPVAHFKGWGWTGKLHHRGLRGEYKSPEDTLEEDGNGKLRDKTGAGHDAPV